jgi:hypothetical protein
MQNSRKEETEEMEITVFKAMFVLSAIYSGRRIHQL